MKEFLKECFKKMTEENYKELVAALKNFKTELKGENFDPSISSHIHVLQSHNHATHSTKTYLMVPAGVEKINEILKEINDKYILEQTGAIRDKIWSKPKAPMAEEYSAIKTKVFYTIAGSLTKQADVSGGSFTARGFKNLDTGKTLILYQDIKYENNSCLVENTGIDIAALTDDAKSECCLKLVEKNEAV